MSVELAFEHYWRGDWDDALDVAQALLAEVEAGGERYMAHGCWHVRSCIRAARGEEGGALDDSARALELARRLGDPQILYPSLARRARVLTDCGSRDEAAGLCNELLLLWTRGGFHLASFWTADLSYVLLGLGRGTELSDRAPKATPATVWLDAACHFVAGRHSEAADVYARIGALPEEATARAEAARNLAASGRRAAAEGERARALAFYHRVDAEASARKSQLSAAPA